MEKDKVSNCGCSDNNIERWSSTINKIPEELKFHFLPEFDIYAPGRSISSQVRLFGYVIFSFEPTDQEKLCVVKVRDVRLRCFPFVLPIDIDKDGRLEGVEIKNLEVGPEVLDLDACKGTLNLETNYFEIDWVIKLSPENLPFLATMEEKTIEVKIPDRGYLDLKKGRFEIHRGIFEINKGPIAGYLIQGTATGQVSHNPPTIDLNVAIVTPGQSGCGDTKREAITICDGDRILLCWSAKNADSVSISPGALKNLSLSGEKIIIPTRPIGSSFISYVADAESGKEIASDSVRVDFYNGEWIRFQAKVDKLTNCWRLDIPAEAYSSHILVDEIQIITGEDCYDWKSLFVKHKSPPYPIGPVNTQSFGFSISSYDPVTLTDKRTLIGTWEFYPNHDTDANGNPIYIDLKDVNKPLCFTLRGTCTKI